MAVIMTITATPVLQASELAFDRAQLAELQKEISPSLMDEVESEADGLINNNSEGFPSYK